MADTRVLLADDNPALLDALIERLGPAPGIVVVAAVRTGADALDRAKTLHPDVAVVDVSMPGGGPDLVRELLRTIPGIRVIGFSADRQESTRLAMTAAGASTYLVKGSASVDLVSAIYGPGGRQS